MLDSKPGLMESVRDRFAHVDTCPFQGKRVFFENAGGALTLKSVVDTTARLSAIPDNQGRDNPASHALVDIINTAKRRTKVLLNASSGQVFVGESGSELLFRLISNAILGSPAGGNVVGTSLEHPASRSAAVRWSEVAGKPYISVPHNDATGSVEIADYERHVTPDTRVATIIHTSPVTGMAVDIQGIANRVREISPECFIIVDGIQHAAHGGLNLDAYNIDGYVISPYKMFSRHGYGIAWISDRLTAVKHDSLIDGPADNWELGTRDTSAYATLSDVVDYFEWLGENFTESTEPRDKIVAAGHAIHNHEQLLTNAMLNGVDNIPGLASISGVNIIGGIDNPRREGLVAMTIDNRPAADIVEYLNQSGIRTHVRKADHYSGNILRPLGLESCVRVSMCHYNTVDEVKAFLVAIADLIDTSPVGS